MKFGRNALCPCGSGKKYKHCCLKAAATPAVVSPDLTWQRLRALVECGEETDFVPVTNELFSELWTPATWQDIIALCGNNVDGEEIMALAEAILWRNIDPTDRPTMETITSQTYGHTAPKYHPQLIEAAILAAADPVFVSDYGPNVPS